jgi:tetratricopeptide (TPR) repeat protein
LQARHIELSNKIKSSGIAIAALYDVTWNELQNAQDKGVDYKLLSDFAWYELRIGNQQNAVKLLEALYEKHPNEYNILANLGTSYEVIGKNEKALELLKKAVAINPASHRGSEWIHIKILEQKVSATPDYTQIINLGIKDYKQWITEKSYTGSLPADSLMIQLAFQLHERISFIPNPDPIVGQLVLDFSDLVAINRKKKTESIPFYNYAVQYAPSLKEIARERVEIIKGKPASTK